MAEIGDLLNLQYPTIDEARKVPAVLVDEAVDVLELLDAVLGECCRHRLAELEQLAGVVTLGVDENVAT